MAHPILQLPSLEKDGNLVVEIAVFPERLDNFQNSTPLIPEI
jgi:hypothetical protein